MLNHWLDHIFPKIQQYVSVYSFLWISDNSCPLCFKEKPAWQGENNEHMHNSLKNLGRERGECKKEKDKRVWNIKIFSTSLFIVKYLSILSLNICLQSFHRDFLWCFPSSSLWPHFTLNQLVHSVTLPFRSIPCPVVPFLPDIILLLFPSLIGPLDTPEEKSCFLPPRPHSGCLKIRSSHESNANTEFVPEPELHHLMFEFYIFLKLP